MADNDRVDYVSNDIGAGQQSASQANRTAFTPGKATSQPGDENWPKDHRIPTGTPAFDGEAAGPVEMNRSRVVKVGRNIVCDQVMQGDGEFPHTGTLKTTVIDQDWVWGTGADPEHTVTPTEENAADGRFERRTGGDNIVGA